MHEPTVVGLDLSLTGAGVGVVTYDFYGLPLEPLEFGRQYAVHTFGRKGKRDEGLSMRHERLISLTQQIREAINLNSRIDLALLETPAQNQTTGSHHDRSGLWWLVVDMLVDLGIPVMEVGVTKIKTYATGKGIGAKDEIMAAAIRRYLDVPISNNNEADAFVLAAMGARLLGDPIEESLPQTHLRAMAGLVLP